MPPGTSSRVSTAVPGSSSGLALAKLIEKKKEYEAISALDRASALYLERIEALAEDCDIMADAGAVHGQVLAQWPKMFQILNQFLSSREEFREGEVENNDERAPSVLPTQSQRLIRVPVEDLQGNSTQ